MQALMASSSSSSALFSLCWTGAPLQTCLEFPYDLFRTPLQTRQKLRFKTRVMARPTRWWSKDTIAVVTGANKGIGYAIARQLAKEHVTVILTARNENLGMSSTEKLRAEGLDIDFHTLDVRHADSIGNLADHIKQKYGGFDILINNAGITDLENSYEKGRVVIETNYFGVKNVTRKLLPLLRASSSGARIVNVSSHFGQIEKLKNATVAQKMTDIDNLSVDKIDAFVEQFLEGFKSGNLVHRGYPNTISAYSVSKIALNAYTRVLAHELADRPEGQKIYVNAISPGFVKTDMTRNNGILSPEEGADTAVWLSLLPPGGSTGQFFYQRKYLEF